RFSGTLFASAQSFEAVEDLTLGALDLQECIQLLFELVALFVTRNVGASTFVENVSIDRSIVGMDAWLNLGETFDDLRSAMELWLKSIRDFATRLGASDEKGEEAADEIMQEVGLLHEQLVTLKHFFAKEGEAGHWIRWIVSDMLGAIT